MKIIVEQSLDCKEPEIRIICGLKDERLNRLIDYVRQFAFSIPVSEEGRTLTVALEDIYYIDTVDNKTFVYLKTEMYESDLKLYQLEEMLKDTPFIRISKSCIVNIAAIKSVGVLFSGQMEAVMKNDEKLIVSRHYLKPFRDKFM